ncbi:MarR family winged helix-turn-helix transcriptional regulator [Dermacoccaceae bacterium W4C1]
MSKALDTSLGLLRAQAVLARRFDNALGSKHGVSLTDFTVLLHLAAAPGGRMRRVDLAEALGLSPSGVTRGLAPLERIGLVERDTDARDARVAYALITETGRERLGDMRVTAQQTAADVFAPPQWDADRVEELHRMLADLIGGPPEA